MNETLILKSNKLYQLLAARFNSIQEYLQRIIAEQRQDNQVLEVLHEYSISFEDVTLNIMKYIYSIKQYFNTRVPKSINTVQAILTTIQKKISGYSRDDSSEKRASRLLSYENNLKSIEEIMDSIWMYEEDIAAFRLGDNPKFSQVYQKIKFIKDNDPQKSEEENSLLAKMMLITNAAVITELQCSNSFFGLVAFGISFPRFALFSQTAQLKTNVFLRDPKINILSEIWNLPQKGAIGALKYTHFDCIQTNKMLYINKNQMDLSLEQTDNTIPVRLIYNEDVEFMNQTKWCCRPKMAKEVSQIILHFHGGGFIALSSSTTQSYTRKWAKSLNIPVLSVDYSMPPENRFPAAIQDALAVYKFIISRLSSFCNINPKKIILAGDSAGGNIACSLMGLILKEKLPIPTGIFMAYPASNLRLEYSPSRLQSFFTPILHPSLVYLCLHQYLGPQFAKLQNHPLASPLCLTNQFVYGRKGDYRFPSNWPKTRLIVGDKDPLFDDSLRLCERMVQSGIDVRCSVYENLSHGFLSLQKVVSRGQQAIIQSIALLQDCLT